MCPVGSDKVILWGKLSVGIFFRASHANSREGVGTLGAFKLALPRTYDCAVNITKVARFSSGHPATFEARHQRCPIYHGACGWSELQSTKSNTS